MANVNKGLGLQECKNSFVVKGKVSGVEKDNFYRELTTKTGRDMRLISFGVEYDKGKTVYLSLNGMERDNVYFSAKVDGKNTIETVPWNQRKAFKKEGFTLIGINLGLTKMRDSKGNLKNEKCTLTEYDACKYIADNLKDDMSVFVKGKLEYSEYNGKHQIKYIPTQISLCGEIDFDSPNFTPMTMFNQQICFMGIEKAEDNEFVVSAKVIGYNSIEDVEYYMSFAPLAKNLRSLKPYTAIEVGGIIEVKHDVANEEDDDGWGYNPMAALKNPTIRRLFITGADKETIDTTIYSEKEIEEAIAKKNSEKTAKEDYGGASDDGWNDGSSKMSEVEDDWD